VHWALKVKDPIALKRYKNKPLRQSLKKILQILNHCSVKRITKRLEVLLGSLLKRAHYHLKKVKVWYLSKVRVKYLRVWSKLTPNHWLVKLVKLHIDLRSQSIVIQYLCSQKLNQKQLLIDLKTNFFMRDWEEKCLRKKFKTWKNWVRTSSKSCLSQLQIKVIPPK